MTLYQTSASEDVIVCRKPNAHETKEQSDIRKLQTKVRHLENRIKSLERGLL